MEDIIEGPAIFQPERALERLLDKYTQPRFYLDGIVRKERYRYPVNALREALVNAVCHRRHMSNQHTTVAVYPDSVEICNPGKLPEGWTAENLFAEHRSAPPNLLIAQAFHDMGLLESWGVGVKLIRDECEKAGIPRPVYKVGVCGVNIIFKSGPWSDTGEDIPAEISTEGLTPSEVLVYKLIAEGEFKTAEAAADVARLSVATVNRATVRLKDKGLIHRIGSDKTGAWALTGRNCT